jgi:hypothetical protein
MKKWQYLILALIFLVVGLFSISSKVFAQYTSQNYQINQVFFGNGGSLQSSSNSYQAQVSIGELGVGNYKSNSYQIQAGFNTSDKPVLEVNVNGGTFVLGDINGVLYSNVASTNSTTFTVENYLSHGYVVIITGNSPTDGPGGHALNALATPTQSNPGTEQFGINLIQNISPAVGTNPQYLPNSTFSTGYAYGGYSTPNYFEYVPNTEIAYSNSSSGQTQYTLSVLENISNSTPAGVYTGSLSVVAVPTF